MGRRLAGVFKSRVGVFPSRTGFLLLGARVPLCELLLREKVLVQGYTGCAKLKRSFCEVTMGNRPRGMRLVRTLLSVGGGKRRGHCKGR